MASPKGWRVDITLQLVVVFLAALLAGEEFIVRYGILAPVQGWVGSVCHGPASSP
jgi:hypothetical protein